MKNVKIVLQAKYGAFDQTHLYVTSHITICVRDLKPLNLDSNTLLYLI